MKRLILLLISAILLLTLAACGGSQDLSTPPDPEDELALCQSALEAFQAQKGWQVHESSEYQSDIILNSTGTTDHWKHGEDWLQVSDPLPEDPQECVFGYLCKNGERYSTEWGSHEGLGGSWADDLKWGADRAPYDLKPWLENFIWTETKIAYVSTELVDGQKVITVLVTTPWVCSEENPDLGVADEYTVAFSLNAKGILTQAVVDVTFKDARGGVVTIQHTVHTIVSTDEAKAAARIDGEYARAMEQIASLTGPTALPTGSFESTDGSVEFTWALPVRELELEKLPTVEGLAHIMTGEDARKIAQTLLGNAEFYELTPDRQLSRSELEKKIQIMEQYPSQEALDKLWGTDDSDAYMQVHRQSLEIYRNLLETAPEESDLPKCSWALKEESHQSGQWLRAITSVDGIDYSLTLNTAQYEDGRWVNSLVIAMGDEDPVSYTPAMHQRSQLCTTREPTQEDYAACLTRAQDFLDKMGMGEYQVIADQTYVDPAYFHDDQRFEIYVRAVPLVEGHPVLWEITGSERYGATVVHFSFNADGDLIVFNLLNPVDPIEVRDTFIPIELEELLERGKQWLMCRTPEDLDRHGNLFMKRLETDGEVTARVAITDLQYGLAPKDWGDVWKKLEPPELQLYTPTLLFKGTVDYYDKATGQLLTGSGSPYGPRQQLLLPLDALTGDKLGQ